MSPRERRNECSQAFQRRERCRQRIASRQRRLNKPRKLQPSLTRRGVITTLLPCVETHG
jgi:hypothetical protein